MSTFTLPPIPAPLHWHLPSVDWQITAQGGLAITAGPATDWFSDPAGVVNKADALVALFTPPDPNFQLSAQVTVQFGATFDAGVILLYVDADHWAKLCFEFSPQGEPMVVSVVTRGASDDCNSTVISDNTVYLRVNQNAQCTAFHYSIDGELWHLVRYFTLGDVTGLQVGFSAQSPTGSSCQATFAAINYQPGSLADIRNGA